MLKNFGLKNVKSIWKMFITTLLACTLFLGMCPIKAFADENNVDKHSNVSSYDPTWEPKVDKALVEKVLGDFGLWKGLPGVMQWAISGFVNDVIVPGLYPKTSGPSPEMLMLQNISIKQDKMLDELQGISQQLTETEYNQILNQFNQAEGPKYLAIGSQTLNRIDEQYKDYFDGIKPMTEDIENQIIRERKNAVLDSLGIDQWSYKSALTNFDIATSNYAKLITTNYYTHGNCCPLFGIKQNQMRQNTLWEHEAWNTLEDFNSSIVSVFEGLAMLETLSLNARIEWCKDNSEPFIPLEVRLSQLKQEMNAVADTYAKYNLARNTSYKHFWHNSADLYFESSAKNYTMPTETHIGKLSWDSAFNKTDGYKGNIDKNSIKEEFWTPIRPNGAITTNIVNEMLASTGHSVSLKDILAKGGFDNIPNLNNEENPAIMLLDTNDAQNPFSVTRANSTSWQSWMPQPKGVKADQTTALNKAYAVNSYKYMAKQEWNDMYWDYYYKVEDKRNKNEVYYSLIPKNVVQVNTSVNGGSNNGYIKTNENITLSKGFKVESCGNRLDFFNETGKVFTQQIASANMGKTFVKWTCNNPELIANNGTIQGIINENTNFTAEYEDGLQANILALNNGFVQESGKIVSSQEIAYNMTNVSDIQYKIEGKTLNLKWNNASGQYFEKCVAPVCKKSSFVGWAITNQDVINDSQWHNLDMNVINNDKSLQIVANFDDVKGILVHAKFNLNNSELGGFCVGDCIVESEGFDAYTKDGVVNCELSLNGCNDQVLKLSWIDALTGDFKSYYVCTCVNPECSDYNNIQLEEWTNLANPQIKLNLENNTYTFDFNAADSTINFEAKFIVE